jgi:hypothetical protein
VPPPKPIVGPYLVDVSSTILPFDFDFSDHLYGSGFKPGEQVTVTVEASGGQSVTAVAEGSGNFDVTLRYSWLFCGPRAIRHSPPTLHAVGNKGSTAALTKSIPPCPGLESQQQLPPTPTPGPGGNGTVIAGTAVAGTAVVITIVPSTPGTVPGTSTPHPWPTPQPFLLTFDVWGFGFAQGEKATVQETDFPGIETLPSAHTTADNLGRWHVTMQAYVRRCSPLPTLVARGDAGTTATAPLNWRDPIMAPCPAPVLPVPSSTLPVPAPTQQGAGQPARILQFATVPGYRVAVAGRRWARDAHLTFALREQSGRHWVRSSMVLQATSSGSILVGVSHLKRCAGLQVTVVDRIGHTVRLGTLQASCTATGKLLKPVLTVLKGKLVAHQSV